MFPMSLQNLNSVTLKEEICTDDRHFPGTRFGADCFFHDLSCFIACLNEFGLVLARVRSVA